MTNPNNAIYLPNTLVRCDHCDHKFRATEPFEALRVDQFIQAARIEDTMKFTCPNCHTIDRHWVCWRDQQDVVLPTYWLSAEKKRGWYSVYLLQKPPLEWHQANPTAKLAMVKRFGSEIARFKNQGNTYAYARNQAREFGKTSPEYFAIVVI